MNKAIVASVIVLALAGTPAAMADPPGPLTLKDAIEMALRNSGQVEAARLAADVAQGQTGLRRSAFRPNLFTGSGAAYTNGFPSTASGAAPSLFNLSYDQTLFNPPLRGQLRAAEDETKAKQVAIDEVKNDVIVQVASDYLELGEVRHSVDLLQQELKSAEQVIAVTQQRVQAGLELPIDETRAELTRAKINERFISFQGREDVLEEALRTSTGIPDGQPIVLTSAKLPPETALSTSQLQALALAHSPALHEAEINRQARLDNLKGQRGGYWPTIDFVGQYMVLSRINNYDQYFRSFQRNNLNVGVQVQIPLFRSRTSAAVALAQSQYQEAETELGNRQKALEIQVQQEARTKREQDAALEVARLELKLAQENLDMVQAQFNQGRATLATVEQARLDESEKWLNFLGVNFQGQKAQLELMRTTGQLTLLLQ
ncbi:MAG TPA: TolC family protein [Candidatus Dormibacteraeota bacterium]|nr:TolC family protein [Candidatus Dormibacteraeota bacterium]